MGKSRSPDLEAVLCDVCVQLAAPLFCEVSPEMINEYSVTRLESGQNKLLH